jgi:TetR/AcrR family transcriptional repressor of nem operon
MVDSTAKLMRERGTAGTSLQDVMAELGLTVGGFYKHFGSKEELMSLAATHAFSEMQARIKGISEQFPDRSQARSELLRDYLSSEHRDSPGSGCPGTALSGDATRASADSPLRNSYVGGVEETLRAIVELEDVLSSSDEEARRHAIVDFATMVGALTLARATVGTSLSDEFLRVVLDSLTARNRDEDRQPC